MERCYNIEWLESHLSINDYHRKQSISSTSVTDVQTVVMKYSLHAMKNIINQRIDKIIN
jgi:hypothetical protein